MYVSIGDEGLPGGFPSSSKVLANSSFRISLEKAQERGSHQHPTGDEPGLDGTPHSKSAWSKGSDEILQKINRSRLGRVGTFRKFPVRKIELEMGGGQFASQLDGQVALS